MFGTCGSSLVLSFSTYSIRAFFKGGNLVDDFVDPFCSASVFYFILISYMGELVSTFRRLGHYEVVLMQPILFDFRSVFLLHSI